MRMALDKKTKTKTHNPAMVTLARESRSMTQTDLANLASLQQGTVSKLESGSLALSDEPIRSIAKVLRYPEAFFSQTDAVYPFGSTTFYHRRLQSVPAATLRCIEAKVNIYRHHVIRLLRATDLDKRCQFRRINTEECKGRIEEIAQLVRASWHLSPGPVVDLTRSIEDAGGIVIRFDFGTNQMFGMSEWIPPALPLFFLNDNSEISADRDRFTLAHELGHVILHGLPNPNMEDEADRFAAEFLMPERDVRTHLIAPIKLHTVARLKPFWKVSMAALIDRARSLSIINENQYVYLRIQLQQKGYRFREPAELNIPREQPSLLKEIIQAHVSELGFGYSDIAAMLNIHVAELRSMYGLDESSHGLQLIRRA